MFKRLFYGTLFILVWVYSLVSSPADYDLFARLAVGKIFINTGQVLLKDPFSYTKTIEWIDHEWGSGVIFYIFSHYLGGDVGLIILKILLFFTIFFLASKTIALQNKKPGEHKNIIFYFIIMTAVFWLYGHVIRCQLFTFTFFTLWIYLLERVRRGETRLLWLIPLTLPVWANLHGGFIAGLGLLGMYTVGEFFNKKPFFKYILAGIPAALLTLINPYGIKYWKFILYATTLNRVGISEWQPTTLIGESQYDWIRFKVILVLAIISTLFYFIKNRPKWAEIDKVKYILLGVTLYLSLSHIKHQFFFIITFTIFCYHNFYAIFDSVGTFLKEKIKITSKILPILDKTKNSVLYFIIITLGLAYIAYTPLQFNIPVANFPVGSVEFLRLNKVKGNMLTVFHWGSYVAWKLYPNILIAMDGRFEEAYPLNTYKMLIAFMLHVNAPQLNIHWDNILKKYPETNIILIQKPTESQKATYNKLKESEEWVLVFQDYISAVFIKKDSVKDNYIKPEEINMQKINSDKYINNINF